jgi:hypothetical protein
VMVRGPPQGRPAASMAFWFASEIMPASATTVTSGRWWAAVLGEDDYLAACTGCVTCRLSVIKGFTEPVPL